ncbi:hypothetical protein [Cellulomonas xylanilytica]|uniref:Uncharacterized protein n=1 Tax=Cellulomonas xylanilytica TaxID=233583 RepID=A0A510V1J5_9CELL|nr:hypothetical protein [Cellulomonas xylanilytica]GEK20773.1 hypothetical protein CXY01_12930 [Cellulomonas xylanilytica]
MTEPLGRETPFGRFVVDDRAFVDDVLRAAATRGGDPELVRAAVLDVAGAADRLADGDDLDPRLGRALLGAATDLAARGRWRAGTVERATVLELVPRLAALVRARPDVVVPLLVASARTVERSADTAVVADLLAAAPPTDDVDHLRATVLVATWRAGAVRYRAAALAAAARLPAPLAVAALGLAPGTDPGPVLDAHTADPWWWPGREQAAGVLRRVGGFRGLGGPWLAVPQVSAGATDAGLGCRVRADGECWAVLADVHGGAVVRLDEPDVEERAAAVPRLAVPWDDEVTGWAAAGGDPRVVVVSRRHSYWVDVVRVAS